VASSNISLVNQSSDILKVTGFRLDGLQGPSCIAKLFNNLGEYFEGSSFPHKRFFEQCDTLLDGQPYFTGESWPEVRCRTLIANRFDLLEGAISEAVEQYEAIKKAHIDELYLQQGQLKKNWDSAWFRMLPEFAAVCKTSRGFAALMPVTADTSCEFFMIEGSDLPFVLWPILGFPAGLYRFVGGCYIHGLMKGEAWKHVASPSDCYLI
jgi:hypothetical protein